MNKKQDKVAEKDFFNRVSLTLESQHVLANEEKFINYNEIFQVLGLKGGDRVKILDAGAGWGSFSIRLAKIGHRVTAVDLSEKLCKVIGKRALDNKLMLDVCCGDVESLPFKDKTFDACFVGGLLHHFHDCSRVMNELNRIVVDKIYIIEPNGSNVVIRFSRWLGSLPFLNKVLSKYGGASLNETIHSTKTYIRLLEQTRFKNIQISSTSYNYRSATTKEFTKTTPYWMQVMFWVRNLLWITASAFLPKAYSDTLVLLKAEK